MPRKPSHDTLTSLHDHDILVDSREIFLYGRGELEDVNSESAMTFLKNIRFLDSQNNKTIIVHQYSTGGLVESGFVMFDGIKNATSPIVFILYGGACSMSTVIPLAADLVISMPSTYFLLHEGNSSIHPDHTFKQARAWYEYDTDVIAKILTIYSEACINGEKFKGKTIEQVKRYIKNRMNEKEDWVVDSLTAKKLGIVSAIFGERGYEDFNTIRAIYDK